ncbi:MAG TPA: chemotaxis protein CheC [Chloroflexota bacterium]|nr:chemotaxis protein CheC [Chloroflexota bacterium]
MNEESRVSVTRGTEEDRRTTNRGRRLSDVLRALSVVADIGFQRSSRGLSEMTGTPIEAKAAQVRKVPMPQVPQLVGGEEILTAAAYVKIVGDVEGHMLLLLPMQDALRLVSMVLGEPEEAGAELSDMARSALGEVGNITCSFFLCALADSTGLEISPSPPAVAVDMAGAVMDTVLADLATENDEVFVIDTHFAHSDNTVNAIFLVLPRLRYIDLILDRLPK